MNRLAALTVLVFTLDLPRIEAEVVESFVTNEKPAALVFQKAPETPQAIDKFFGDPSTRHMSESIGVAVTDGSRIFATADHHHAGHQVGIWRIQNPAVALKLEGILATEAEWRVSPDGKYFFGRPPQKGVREEPFALFRADTWDGLWQLDRSKISDVGGLAFSTDGTLVALLVELSGKGAHVIVLEALTGKSMRVIRVGDELASGTNEGRLIFTQDAILLAPTHDAEGRITRISLRDWKPELVNVPKGNLGDELENAGGLVASSDGRWLVVRGETAYAVLERTGSTFSLCFEGEVEQPDQPGLITLLQTTAISPDNRQLVVSGGCQHKIFDIASRKVVHEDALRCRCGFFSRDGRTFWRTCAPFQPIDPATWEVSKGWDPHGHIFRVWGLAFSPDGKWLASCDESHLYVWPVDGSDPVAECQSSRKLPWFQSPFWSKDGTRIIGADGFDFLTWRWTAPAAQRGLASITGENILGKTSDTYISPKPMKIVSDSAEKQFLVYQGRDGGRDSDPSSVRYPDKPGVVRHLRLPESLHTRSIDASRAVISEGDKEIMYSFNGLHAYSLADGSLRSNVNARRGNVVAHDPVTRSTIVMDPRRLSIFSDETLQETGTIPAPVDLAFEYPFSRIVGLIPDGPIAISADGHYLAFCGDKARSLDGPAYLILADLRERKIVAAQPQSAYEFTAAAFTPDAKKLAIGHLNGSISLWDVERLVATAPPSPPSPPPVVTSTPVSKTTPKANSKPTVPNPRASRTLPTTPVQLKDGTYLRWMADGGVGFDKILPEAGILAVNGVSAVPVALREKALGLSWREGRFVLTALDGKLRIERYVIAGMDGHVSWLDTVDNLSEQALEFDFDIACTSAIPLSDWKVESGEPMRVSSGEASLPTDAQAVYTVAAEAGTESFGGFLFAMNPAPQRPKLLANGETGAITARHHLRLAPLERRMLMHVALLRPMVNSAPTHSIGYMKTTSNLHPQMLFHPVGARLSVNVGEPPSYKQQKELEAKAKPNTPPDSPFFPDNLGFKWTLPRTSFAFSTEMGLVRCLEPWVDDSPLVFKEERLDVLEVRRGTTFEWSNASGTLRILRTERLKAEKGTATQLLEIENTTTKPQHFRLRLMNVAGDRIAAVLNGQGETLDASQPVPFAKHQGRVAVVCAGATQPATLLALGGFKGKVSPTVRLVDNRVLLVDYDLNLAARESIVLFHAAAQRPLSAYGKPSEALASWDLSSGMGTLVLPNDTALPLQNWLGK